MQSNAAKAGVLVILIAVAAGLFLVLKDDDSGDSGDSGSTTATSAQAPVKTIEVDQQGKPVGGVQELTVNRGEKIRFDVHSAVADDVHLHGYNIGKDVEAGGTVSFDVPATLEGEFEAELEQRHEQILDLTVNP
ncbi:MAG: hypothetical protein ACXWEF_03675 [Solirubrobacterales bacterium]